MYEMCIRTYAQAFAYHSTADHPEKHLARGAVPFSVVCYLGVVCTSGRKTVILSNGYVGDGCSCWLYRPQCQRADRMCAVGSFRSRDDHAGMSCMDRRCLLYLLSSLICTDAHCCLRLWVRKPAVPPTAFRSEAIHAIPHQ